MSVKTGSIFEKTKVPLAKWLHVVVLWTIETSVTNTCALTSMSMHTVIDLFQFLRDICGGKLLQNPVQLGGIDATHWSEWMMLPGRITFWMIDRRVAASRLLTIRKYPVAGVVLVLFQKSTDSAVVLVRPTPAPSPACLCIQS
jgi:hypothetical protein